MQYGAQTIFFCQPEQLPAIQRLVKKHNCRFVGNPAKWVTPSVSSMVTVGCDDMKAFNAFQIEAYEIIHPQQKPPLPKPSRFIRLVSLLGFGQICN